MSQNFRRNTVLTIDVNKHSEAKELILKGELNLENVHEIENVFLAELDNDSLNIGLNCKHLRNMDSSGLGLIIKFSNIAKGKGVNIVLFNFSKNIETIFDTSKLNNYFNIVQEKEFIENYT